MLQKINELSELTTGIISEEESILANLELKHRLSQIVSSADGLKRFAEAFYFVRYDFTRLNFIVGARCGSNERLWAGLAKNLMEELGGRKGPSHNQLYRDFLACVSSKPENTLSEPSFASHFNLKWEQFCREAPLSQALSAIAVYEIFDNPDYKILLDAIQQSGVPQSGLTFFQVHARAQHFEMFEEVVTWLRNQAGGEEAFNNGKRFVFQTQRAMWVGLLEHLELVPEAAC